jgi:hypothetical protein
MDDSAEGLLKIRTQSPTSAGTVFHTSVRFPWKAWPAQVTMSPRRFAVQSEPPTIAKRSDAFELILHAQKTSIGSAPPYWPLRLALHDLCMGSEP